MGWIFLLASARSSIRVSAIWLGMPNEAAKMLVAIMPEQMRLTRMLSGPSCAAAGVRHVDDHRSLRRRIEHRPNPVLNPAIDAVEMIEPPPALRVAGAALFIPNIAARTCRCITESKPARRHAIGGLRAPPTPALLNSTSSLPNSDVAAAPPPRSPFLHHIAAHEFR